MSSGDVILLVGLGNPGKKYTSTRHNIGFMVLEKLASLEGVKFKEKNKFKGLLTEITSNQKILRLLMPTTFMNESGISVKATLDWFGISINQMIVIVDDIDLPLGKLRLREKGSSGGHNGLKSIIQHIGSENFSRLRIGIGAPSLIQEERKQKTIKHVLGEFTNKEIKIVNQIINEVINGFNLIQNQGISKAATKINSYRPDNI